MPAALDARGLLETLVRHEVEFIVVGGVAAVLLRAPITTMGLNIVHRRMVVAATPVMVLKLEQLMELKQRLGRTKDKLALPILQALLEERRSS